MYFNIWQSHDLSRIDDFYAKNFKETIDISNENNEPIEINLGYDELVQQVN